MNGFEWHAQYSKQGFQLNGGKLDSQLGPVEGISKDVLLTIGG